MSDNAAGGASATTHLDDGSAPGLTGDATPDDSDAGSREPATSLTFQVTTRPVGGAYAPKNVGAIWVEDRSGTLIRTLQVWAALREHDLTRYNATRGGASIDVTSTATLPSHRSHQVIWDLKDREGLPTASGQYALVVELSDDESASGASISLPFDTGVRALVITPPDAKSFVDMKLQLQ